MTKDYYQILGVSRGSSQGQIKKAYRKQAAQGMEKDLVRRGKKLRVKIPAGVKHGSKVKLRNARQLTDGQPGDIIIVVRIK